MDRQPIAWAEILSLFKCAPKEIEGLSGADNRETEQIIIYLVDHPK